MANYIRPQVQVFQEFRQLPQDVVANLNAFVFGSNYRLFRYAVASEKASIGLGAYDPTVDATYDFPNQPAGSTVDLDYVKLFMEDVWALYATIGASASTPLVAVSPAARNKLRAAPRIEDAEEAKQDAVTLTDGVAMDVGGYIYDSPEPPETLYMWPTGGAVGGFMSRLSARSGASGWNVEDSTLEYLTMSEIQRGEIDIPATDAPLTSGNTIQGPYGLVLDLDAGVRAAGFIDYTGQPTAGDTITITVNAVTTVLTADVTYSIGATARETYDNLKAYINALALIDVLEVIHVYGGDTATGRAYIVGIGGSGHYTGLSEVQDNATAGDVEAFSSVRQPVELTLRNTAGDASFTVVVDPDSIGSSIDESIDNGVALKVQYGLNSGGAGAATWDSVNRRVFIDVELGVTTLGEMRAALVGNSDVAAVLDMGELDEADEDELVDLIVDETGSPVTSDWDVYMLRDAYRVRVLANDITWKTGNGYAHSADFKSRGVQVGDRLRYSVVAPDSETYEGTTEIAAIEADTIAPQIQPGAVDIDNQATLSGDLLTPKTGADIIVAGADNQREFDGVNTAVYALDPSVNYFPGNYSVGVVADTYTIEITTGGAANTARAQVSTDSGAYSRVNVPITGIHWDDPDVADMAMIYLGDNLWAVLHKGTTDADALFQVGDSYTFSSDVDTPWRSVAASSIASAGDFVGSRDTTYQVEVVRGGVFDRAVNTIEGMLNPNRATLVYTLNPIDGDTLTLGGVTFEFDDNAATTAGNVAVDIEAAVDDTYTNLLDAINAQGVHMYAEIAVSTNTLSIRGPESVLTGAALSGGFTGGTLTVETAVLTPQLDFDAAEWLAGDVDDEYVLRCTLGGTILNAQFALESQRGDNQSVVEFTGTGISGAEDLGANGLSAYFTLSAPSVDFSTGDFWLIRVNGTRPRVRITDTAGIDQASYAVVNNAEELSLGLYGAKLTFATNSNNEAGFASNGGLLTGDKFYVECSAAAAGPYKTLVLSDDLPEAVTTGLAIDDSGAIAVYSANYNPTEFSTWLYLVQATTEIDTKKVQSPPDRNWTADADGITVNGDIAVQDSSWTEVDGEMPYLPVYGADLYSEYRALVADYADAIYSLNDIADVAGELGTVHPDNPLAQGVYNALLNSGEQPVYFMAVPSDDLAGFSAVLNQAEKTDSVYGLNPLTRDLNILAAVEAHINGMSGASEKRWRIGFVGTELPSEEGVYTAATHGSSEEWLATITDDPNTAGEQYTLLECANGEPTFMTDVSAGDEIRISYATDAWGDETYASYTVDSVVSNTKLLLVSGPAAAINVATKFELWHPRSTAEIATAVAARSNYFGSRRMYHIFPAVGYLDGVAQTAEFLASAVAGLNSSVVPQRGLTNTEVNGFDSVPAVYAVYSAVQLDEMADSGTFILMQDSPGNQVYCRHQVSTAGGDDNILTTELSVTKNLDAISYYFANVLAPFIGRYNITDELLTVIGTQVDDGINFLGSDRTGAGLVGPMLILGENTVIRSIEQHPTLQDHIVIIVDLELPLPLNVIQLRLVV